MREKDKTHGSTNHRQMVELPDGVREGGDVLNAAIPQPSPPSPLDKSSQVPEPVASPPSQAPAATEANE